MIRSGSFAACRNDKAACRLVSRRNAPSRPGQGERKVCLARRSDRLSGWAGSRRNSAFGRTVNPRCCADLISRHGRGITGLSHQPCRRKSIRQANWEQLETIEAASGGDRTEDNNPAKATPVERLWIDPDNSNRSFKAGGNHRQRIDRAPAKDRFIKLGEPVRVQEPGAECNGWRGVPSVIRTIRRSNTRSVKNG